MNGACRDQEVVVLLRGDLVDILLSVKRRFTLLRLLQRRDQVGDLYAFLQSQVYAGAFLRVQNVVALVLGISHSELPVNVFCGRVDLQRQVLPSHCIQKVEADRELRAKARVHFFPQQFLRVPEDQVHGRHLQDRSVEVKAYAVLFRHSVEAPRVIGLVRVQSAHLLHPLPAPHSGVKIGNDPERL